MDCINIKKLEIFAYHGVNEEEKENGQTFFINATIYSDIVTPGLSDDLEDTVNYSKVCKFINKFFTENRFDLIEAAAIQTSRAVLKNFPKIRKIDLEVNKPEAPVSLSFENISVKVTSEWKKAYLSIGSNMGDKEAYLNGAVEEFYNDDNCRVNAVSNFVETKPYGPVEQDNFLNGCVEIETLYSARELLDRIHEIENDNDRTREVHWGPRTLDIDIVFFGEEVIDEPDLKIPHIEMHKRAFVLEPLNQIAPNAVHPLFGKSVGQLRDECDDDTVNKCAGCGGCPANK